MREQIDFLYILDIAVSSSVIVSTDPWFGFRYDNPREEGVLCKELSVLNKLNKQYIVKSIIEQLEKDGYDVLDTCVFVFYTNDHADNLYELSQEPIIPSYNVRPVIVQQCDLYGNIIEPNKDVAVMVSDHQSRNVPRIYFNHTDTPLGSPHDIFNLMQYSTEAVEDTCNLYMHNISQDSSCTECLVTNGNLTVPATFVPKQYTSPQVQQNQSNNYKIDISGGFSFGPLSLNGSFKL